MDDTPKLKFSPANSKLKKLEQRINRKVYSFDLLSGLNCVGAKNCFAKVIIKQGRRKLIRGKHTQFTCYSASQEVNYTNVYNLRKHNSHLIKQQKTKDDIVKLIESSLPKKAEVIRIHSAGDSPTQIYFDAWLEVCKNHPNMNFYAYTKSLLFWIARLKEIPDNLSLVASRGGHYDHLIDKYLLKEARVVYSEQEAKNLNLEIDRDDYHAYSKDIGSFALEIHGVQKSGSLASKAVSKIMSAHKLKNNAQIL